MAGGYFCFRSGRGISQPSNLACVALTLSEWVERERTRQVRAGLPERISDPGALGLVAALMSTRAARSAEPAGGSLGSLAEHQGTRTTPAA